MSSNIQIMKSDTSLIVTLVMTLLTALPIALMVGLVNISSIGIVKLLEIMPPGWPLDKIAITLALTEILIVYAIMSKRGLNGLNVYVNISVKVLVHISERLKKRQKPNLK